MTGLVRKATIFCVCGLLAASAALAHVPDPTKCQCGPIGGGGKGALNHIYLVGTNLSTPDPKGLYCVTVRDANNVPIENSLVLIDFSQCLDAQLCYYPLGSYPGDPNLTVDCVAGTVRKLTNAQGQACFDLIGKSRAPVPALSCSFAQASNCVRIYADGVHLCDAIAPTFDLVNEAIGGDKISLNDLAEWGRLFFCPNNPYFPRADYFADGIINLNDLANWGN